MTARPGTYEHLATPKYQGSYYTLGGVPTAFVDEPLYAHRGVSTVNEARLQVQRFDAVNARGSTCDLPCRETLLYLLSKVDGAQSLGRREVTRKLVGDEVFVEDAIAESKAGIANLEDVIEIESAAGRRAKYRTSESRMARARVRKARADLVIAQKELDEFEGVAFHTIGVHSSQYDARLVVRALKWLKAHTGVLIAHTFNDSPGLLVTPQGIAVIATLRYPRMQSSRDYSLLHERNA